MNEDDDIQTLDEYLRSRKSNRHIPADLLDDVKEYAIEFRSQGFTIREIGEALNISTQMIRGWLTNDPVFASGYADAETNINESIEKEAIRRARDGVLEVVVSNGRVVMDPADATKPLYIRKYSDDLTKFILKGRMRDTYGDRVENTNNHTFSTEGALDELKSLIEAASGEAT